jgi:hypothetical protein
VRTGGRKLLQAGQEQPGPALADRAHLFPDEPFNVDCHALINRQLDGILLLIRRLEGSNDDRSKLQWFREVGDRAVLHVLSRETVLLPAWRRAEWRQFPLVSFAAHVQFKRALAELLVRPPRADGFVAALGSFGHQAERQRALDGEFLIPGLRSAMDVQQRRDLCNEIELLFDVQRTAVDDAGRRGASAGDLLAEAEIVLSSLSARGPAGRQPPGGQRLHAADGLA